METDATVAKLLHDLPALNQESFENWAWDACNILLTGGIWSAILQTNATGTWPACPILVQTAAQCQVQADYDSAMAKAAIWILTAAGRTHREITKPHSTPPNAPAMWDAIFACYARRDAGGCFGALQTLLSAHKQDSEIGMKFIQRVESLSHSFECLMPTAWTLLDLISKLKCSYS